VDQRRVDKVLEVILNILDVNNVDIGSLTLQSYMTPVLLMVSDGIYNLIHFVHAAAVRR